jgi:SSS family solute:Na+ symporter
MRDGNAVQLGVFLGLFVLVTLLGFGASRWRPSKLDTIDDWGLGGRSFGGWVSWFLVGGDLYTAYTFIAVPALLFATGAYGFFAMPYTAVVYPLAFVALARLWSVAHVHGMVTPADFVRARYSSPTLALLVAICGIVATMPYIALQLVGVEAVLKAMGITGRWPIVVAFTVMALYTYRSGLRAPALISFVKDALIFWVALDILLAVALSVNGWSGVFDAAEERFVATPNPADGLLLGGNEFAYATTAFGSALALFLYPHAVTGVLAARSRDTVRRIIAGLPAYSFVLGLMALVGFVAIAEGVVPIGADPAAGVPGDRNTVAPQAFQELLPDWGVGVAFAAIGVGALVPAAIMSIAAANLFTRNVYREFMNPDATPEQQARVGKVVSLLVKFGAVAVILFLDPHYAIDLQLLGGVIILQTLPAVAVGLHTRWLHRAGLFAGLVAGLVVGTAMLYQIPQRGGPDGTTVLREHFGGSSWPLANLGFDTKATVYVGIVALLVNLAVSVVVTIAARLVRVPAGRDLTRPEDYTAERGDPRVQDLVELVDGEPAATRAQRESIGVAAIPVPRAGMPPVPPPVRPGPTGYPGDPEYRTQWNRPAQRGYPGDPGVAPGYPAQSGYRTDPGYQPEPGDPAPRRYPPAPGYDAQPGYHGEVGRRDERGYPPGPGYPSRPGYQVEPRHSEPDEGGYSDEGGRGGGAHRRDADDPPWW